MAILVEWYVPAAQHRKKSAATRHRKPERRVGDGAILF
jgi:hypothetical protein